MFTYFIKSGDYVKIGITCDIERRIKSLRHASPGPIEFLLASDITEKQAHYIAGQITERANGEWFKINPKLIEWIGSLNKIDTGYNPSVRPPGRPATGITKSRPSITIDKKIEKMGRKAALLEGISFSAWVEKSIRMNLDAVVGRGAQ